MDFICGYCMGVKWICEATPCPGRQAAIDARLREARRIKSPRSEFRHSRTECSMSGQRFLVSCCEVVDPDLSTAQSRRLAAKRGFGDVVSIEMVCKPAPDLLKMFNNETW